MIVQRILPIALLTVYLVMAVGVNVLHHTCGGTTDTNFAPVSQEDPCGCADVMDPADRCCTVEITTFQLHDDQVAPAVMTQPTLDASHVVYPLFEDAPAAAPVAARLDTFASSPPTAIPATILFCTLLI